MSGAVGLGPHIAVHLLVDLYGVRRADDVAFLEEALLEAARAAGCTVEGVVRKKFEPQGASVVVLVSESHLSVHSWPEHDYVAVDVFTCGVALREKAVDVLKARLQPERVEVTELGRGRLPAAHDSSHLEPALSVHPERSGA